ncbi:hypothetical protein ASG95_09910 [Phycicoccus sp. Soil803]|nr:hypothetical protein ASG95_09910 [Phycicoccus sp. Soil803]
MVIRSHTEDVAAPRPSRRETSIAAMFTEPTPQSRQPRLGQASATGGFCGKPEPDDLGLLLPRMYAAGAGVRFRSPSP